ncbi:F-BAR domain only protein 1-like, partial [Chiloscyllium plagiosum]|uniref:F-BAR domain only protein 1-like n=1 Tax=Chiloscyllium plagiosum TaxID=36176 RepID=UPI001CB81E8F
FWWEFLDFSEHERETQPCSSSDSDFDDDEPRKFHVEIKPVTVRDWAPDPATSVEQLRASVGNIVLSSNPTIPSKRNSTRHSIQLAPLAVEGNSQGAHMRGKVKFWRLYQMCVNTTITTGNCCQLSSLSYCNDQYFTKCL